MISSTWNGWSLMMWKLRSEASHASTASLSRCERRRGRSGQRLSTRPRRPSHAVEDAVEGQVRGRPRVHGVPLTLWKTPWKVRSEAVHASRRPSHAVEDAVEGQVRGPVHASTASLSRCGRRRGRSGQRPVHASTASLSRCGRRRGRSGQRPVHASTASPLTLWKTPWKVRSEAVHASTASLSRCGRRRGRSGQRPSTRPRRPSVEGCRRSSGHSGGLRGAIRAVTPRRQITGGQHIFCPPKPGARFDPGVSTRARRTRAHLSDTGIEQ